MKNLQFKLSKDALKKDFKWLNRDFKKDEIVYLYIQSKVGLIGKNGVICTVDGNLPYFVLPAGVLSIEHQGKVYNIFMTEYNKNYIELYAKQGPFDHMALLTTIQNNKPLDDNLILKAHIINSSVLLLLIPLHEIKPLF
jgi:hypothetical protein